MDSLARQLLLWGVTWAIGGALFVYLVRRGVNYVDRFGLTTVFFLVLSIVAGLLFRDLLGPRLVEFGLAHAVLLIALLAAQSLAYAAAHRWLRRPVRFISEHPHIYFLRLDYRYLVSKSFEILFQQVLVASLVLMLADAGLSRLAVVTLCALIFGVAHLPLIAVFGRFFGLFYVGSAAVAGAVFSVLILSRPDGVFYSYMVHWLYYTVSGLAFWAILGRRAENSESESRPGPWLTARSRACSRTRARPS